jgi:hypothetical protein
MCAMILPGGVHPLVDPSLQLINSDLSRSVAIIEEVEVVVGIVSAAESALPNR